MPESLQSIQLGVQNTGNPVLDSLVNLLVARSLSAHEPWNKEDFQATHELLLEAGAKEPGGLQRWRNTL
jgi:hypothetical protein